MEWHYFTVPDDYTGLDVRFRWREALCGYCGTDYQFQVFSGIHGRWVGLNAFVDMDEGFRYCRAIDFRELYKQLAYIQSGDTNEQVY